MILRKKFVSEKDLFYVCKICVSEGDCLCLGLLVSDRVAALTGFISRRIL